MRDFFSFCGAIPLRIRNLFFLILSLTAATELNAQATAIRERLTVDAGLAFLGSVPDEFESNPCGSLFGFSGEAAVGIEVTPVIILESSFSLSALRPATCDLDTPPTPTDGSLTRRVFSDGIATNPFLSTTHRAVMNPWVQTDANPRAPIGIGRLWGKGTWFWSMGFGLRIPLGKVHPLIEVERMGFSVQFSEVTTVWSSGEVISADRSPKMELEESIWAIRLRIPIFR